MLRRRTKVVLIAIAALSLLYLGLTFAIPLWWSGPCGPHCERSLGALWIGPASITLSEVRIEAGNDDVERWEVSASRIVLEPRWAELWTGKPSFRRAEVQGLRVKLLEGDAPKKKSEPGPAPAFRIDALRVVGGRFAYERRYRGRRGSLKFSEINMTAGTLRPELATQATPVKLTALMGKSGQVAIDLNARFFASDPELRLRLTLKALNLQEANEYFRPLDELELRGTLQEAVCEVRGGARELRANVALRFRGFDVDFHAGRERSGFSAALGDLLGSMFFPEDTKGRAYAPGYATITREANESPVGFVLRGLKEAAMKAAQKK